MNSPYDISTFPIIRALGWPTYKELIDSDTQRMVIKSVNCHAPRKLIGPLLALSGLNPFLKGVVRPTSSTYGEAKLWNGLDKAKSSNSLKILIAELVKLAWTKA